jgi:hypothetical protein
MRARERAVVGSEDERIAAALERAGFDVVPAPKAVDALDLLEAEAARLFVIEEGSDPRLLAFLRSLSGVRRREIFVLLCQSRWPTGDRMLAWRESVNYVIHEKDLDGVAKRIEEARAEEKRFHDRFDALLSGAGTPLGGAL